MKNEILNGINLEGQNFKICGIDEAGRGALAGPMAVAACVLEAKIAGLNDSKKLTPKRREELFEKIRAHSKYLIVYFSNAQIDELGLSRCLRSALLLFQGYFSGYELLYDGNASYGTDVATMVQADGKVDAVSAASILAKVSRDRLMDAYDALYPAYGYAAHKGYGTKAHMEALAIHGENEITRKSFKVKSAERRLF